MASLNDVLKEVLEKDFDEKDVDKVVNPDGETTGDDRARTEAEAEQDDHGDSYVGPGDFVQNSVGRGAVESFIKNSVYEKYNIDASSMKSFARMTPTEMLSDFGKTVGDLGRIRSDYQAGKMTAAEYKSAMSHTRGEIVGKMLEMGSSRKSILEDVFLRSVGIGPEERSIHSFRDLVDAFREDEVDPVDTDLNPDAEMPEVEPDEMDINPDAEVTPDTDNPDAELAEAEADVDSDKQDNEETEQAQDQETETDNKEEQPENDEQTETDTDHEEPSPEEQEPELPENDVEPDTETADEPESESNENEEQDGQEPEKEEPPEEEDDEPEENDAQESADTEEPETDEPTDKLQDEIPEQDTDNSEDPPEQEEEPKDEKEDPEPEEDDGSDQGDSDRSESGDRDEFDDDFGEDKKQDSKSDAIENEDEDTDGNDGGDKEPVDEEPESDIDMDDADITDIDSIENYDVDADELDYDTLSPDAEDTEIADSEPDTADVQEPESDSAMDSEEVELEDSDIPGEDNLPDDFDPDAEVDVEADVESLPEEVMEFDNVPDAQDFENMINSDVQDMADYASQYEGAKEDIGDIEDYGDVDVDMDADLGDMEVMEDPIEPEANFEMDIDTSELAEIRKLKALGIGIYFEEQNINSLTEDSEVYIGIYGVMAQSESENISANVKWGINKRMQSGTYACRFNLLGYRRDKVTKEIRIIPEEAEVVKKIFQMYLHGMSLNQIKDYLESNNILTISGNSVWSKNGIKAMLTNEKYVGDVMYQKTYREDCISKKTRINRGELDRYLVTDNHPAIIDRETFRLVKKELVKRSSKRRSSANAITELGKYSGKYALSEILVCDICGSPYRRKTWTRNGVKKIYWRCLNHLENGNNACPQSKGIDETVLHSAICRGLSKSIPDAGDVKSFIRMQIAYTTSEDAVLVECQTLENAIKEIQEKANEAEDMCIRTEGNKQPYMEEIKKYYASITELRERIKLIKQQLESNDTFQSELKQIESWLESEDISFAEYDDSIVRYLIDSIRVTDDQKLLIGLKGGTIITEELYPKAA